MTLSQFLWTACAVSAGISLNFILDRCWKIVFLLSKMALERMRNRRQWPSNGWRA